jgi:hypothetical protein
LACDGFEYLRRQFRVSLGNDIMTSGATGVFNGMAPLAGLSCDLSRIIANDKPPQAEHVQRGARFCGKLSDFRFDQDTFVGLQAEGLCRPDAAVPPAPVEVAEASVPEPAPLPDQPEVETNTQSPAPEPTGIPPVETNPAAAEHLAEPAEASTQPVGENAAAEPAVDPAEAATPVEPAVAATAVEPAAPPRPAGQSFASVCRDLVAIMTLPSGQAQPQERLFAGDALVGILPHLQPAELTNLTRTVARLDLVSEQLRSFLVRHPDNDISCRMLKDATHLSDVDILSLVPGANEQQLRLIARRRMLTTSVCDAIIGNGNRNAILDLLRNSEAELSPGAFTRLLDLIDGDEELTSAFCNRADLPQSVGFKLFWQATSNVRRYLLSRFLTESAALGRVFDVGISAGAIPPLGGQVKPADVEMMIAQIESGSPEAADTLARCCRISPETATLIVNDKGGEPIAVVFKSLAQSRLTMAEALKRWALAGRFGITSNERIIELHAMFDGLSYNKARMLLAYWDWASRDAGPYTSLHS